MPSKIVPQKYKKERQPKWIAFPFLHRFVETQNFASLQDQPIVIYCMTVTRLTITPFSVWMRTMYIPALNWLMFKV